MKEDTLRPSSFSFIAPMQALAVDKLPEGDLLCEVKFDGYRAVAFKDSQSVRLLSRNNKPLMYPQLVDALKLLPAKQLILDGEIVAVDEKGRPSFQLLQNYKSSGESVPLVYYVFDLLFLEGKDLRKEPLVARRKLLAGVLRKAPSNIRFSEGLQGSKQDLLRVAQEFGLEGLVAKRLNSLYESGRRSGAWVKVKLARAQEFVIGGYTPPGGSRKYFGGLLVGYYGPAGLLFAGSAGSGFSEKALETLYDGLQQIRHETCPPRREYRDTPNRRMLNPWNLPVHASSTGEDIWAWIHRR